MPKLLNLTPMGPDWPWYLRLLEVVVQVATYPLAVAASVGERIHDKIVDKFIV